ncbi:MAG: hypothetical protein QG625_3346 [Cyanobacteriota bacterium erpe_2018_sw_39hr_WHONDRS-SW48-000098_B_bin.30]|jgi:hypothetical protein|nr:DUF4240 domain-containing protein [Candidatus Obscuribacter sp.]MDQ5967190.1 hypothetical protein [Cyanobacteriota bacterium erpe_2018_sw_39hr_WHONDRS-SW48-000098_B_bin.30]
MDEVTFWYLIEQSIDAASAGDGEDLGPQVIELKRLLTQIEDVEELIVFQQILDQLMDQAYNWALWGAAYLMMGGLNDDEFEYFRAGLIMKGKEAYETSLREPDELAEFGLVVPCEEMLYLACEVYEERSDDGAIYDRNTEKVNFEPSGDSFDEHDVDYFKEQYPRLWELYGQE